MVEPVETEAEEHLDAFAGRSGRSLEGSRVDPEIAQNAPYHTPVEGSMKSAPPAIHNSPRPF